VVKRAAAQSTSPEVLYRKVAEEIDAPQERDRFLKQAGIGSSASTSPAVIRQNDSKPSPSAPPVPAKQLDTQPIRAASQIKTKPGSSEKYAIVAGAIALAFLFLFALPPVRRAIFGSNADSSKRSRSPEPLQEKQERREEKRAESAPEAAKTEIPKPSAEAAKPDQPKPSTRVSVPAEEMQGRLERKVLPVYPQLARQAHIQGEVIFDADIAKDGVVETLRTVSGHPLLLPAAVDAVKQWRYKPYLHNGEPVAVDTKIVVSFTLK
jgi:TonB family protein